MLNLLRTTLLLWVFGCVFLFAASAGELHAGEITLAWDRNSEPDVVGYKVYFGTASHTYGVPIHVGNVTTYTVSGLTPGTYYFAVTAYNSVGLESGYSNEVWAEVGGAASGCDVNGDGQTNALDLQRLANVILGISSCPGNCDLNGDNRVDALDLQVLGNVILGVRACP